MSWLKRYYGHMAAFLAGTACAAWYLEAWWWFIDAYEGGVPLIALGLEG